MRCGMSGVAIYSHAYGSRYGRRGIAVWGRRGDERIGKGMASVSVRERVTQGVRQSTHSRASIHSVGSFLSVVSLYSFSSILSIASAGSLLSIGSVGSILSIGSSGSILSIGSTGSMLSIGAAGGILRIGGRGRRPGVH